LWKCTRHLAAITAIALLFFIALEELAKLSLLLRIRNGTRIAT
jgi:hypothetical protein